MRTPSATTVQIGKISAFVGLIINGIGVALELESAWFYVVVTACYLVALIIGLWWLSTRGRKPGTG